MKARALTTGRGLPGLLISTALLAAQSTEATRADASASSHPLGASAMSAPAGRPPVGCTVEVRFSEVGRGFFHAYIVTRDPIRGSTHFRAVPAHRHSSLAKAWAFLRRRSPAGGWGPLHAEHGPYVPGSV